MSINNDNFSVENLIASLNNLFRLATDTSQRIHQLISEDIRFSSVDYSVLNALNNLTIMKARFFIEHDSIVSGNNSNIERYYTSISAFSVNIKTLEDDFIRDHDNLLRLRSISNFQFDYYKGKISLIMGVFDALINVVSIFKSTVVTSAVQVQSAKVTAESAATAIVNPIEIWGLDENSEAFKHLQHYIDIASNTDFNDPLFEELTAKIHGLTREVYTTNIKPNIPPILSYASIVGPSFMGKTQFAFSLARFCPVFYANFIFSEFMQSIYEAFDEISLAFKNCLVHDISLLENRIQSLDSDKIRDKASELKLRTIGFLWELVKDSIEFKEGNGTDSDSDWFKYYIRKRIIKYEAMTYKDYHLKLKDLLNHPETRSKGFKPPVVFIDEIFEDTEERIKLLRNLCRILGLRCVLASTSARINNLLDPSAISDAGTAPKDNTVWVNTIRKLPKASIKAIFKSLDWERFLNARNEFDSESLLNYYNFVSNPAERNLFHALVSFLIQQSETCLQGLSLIVFQEMKTMLLQQSVRTRPLLNTRAIWEHILTQLRKRLYKRKSSAFYSDGPYHSLAMLSNCNVISDNSEVSNNPVPTAEVVMQTINNHFYYFACEEYPEIIPFEYDGNSLIYGAEPFANCSYFNLFKDDVLLCMALWIQITANNNVPVADIICRFICNRRNVQALNSCAKECMVYWSLCNSTHREMGAVIHGPEFFIRFIKNIQIDQANSAFSNRKLSIRVYPFNLNVASLKSFHFLEKFLSKIGIPYLVPENFDVKTLLQGLCTFGSCSLAANQSGFDIKFDLLYDNKQRKGLIECKCIDTGLSLSEAKSSIEKAKKENFPFNMLVTYSLCKELKTENYFVSKRGEPQPKKTKSAVNIIDRMAVYSVFYAEQQMKIIPLLEHGNPDGVFVIVQTNFRNIK